MSTDLTPFSMVPEDLLACSGDAVKLWCLLHRFADHETGYCWPSQDTLAERMGCADRTIRRLVSEIMDTCPHRLRRKRRGFGRSNGYWLSLARPVRTPESGQERTPQSGKTGHHSPVKTGQPCPDDTGQPCPPNESQGNESQRGNENQGGTSRDKPGKDRPPKKSSGSSPAGWWNVAKHYPEEKLIHGSGDAKEAWAGFSGSRKQKVAKGVRQAAIAFERLSAAEQKFFPHIGKFFKDRLWKLDADELVKLYRTHPRRGQSPRIEGAGNVEDYHDKI